MSEAAVHFSSALLSVLALLSLLGAIASAVTARHFLSALALSSSSSSSSSSGDRHLHHRPRQRRSISLLFLMDLMVSLLGCILQAMDFVFIASSSSSSSSPGRALCFTLLLPPYVTCIFGTAYMSAVSAVRYATIKETTDGVALPAAAAAAVVASSSTFFSEAKSDKLVASLTVSLLAVVATTLGVWYGCDLPMGMVTELCYRKPDFSYKWGIFLTSVPLLMVMVATGISLSLDLHLLLLLRSRFRSATGALGSSTLLASSRTAVDRAGYLRIPVRATVCSAASLLPMVFCFIAKFPSSMMGSHQVAAGHFMLTLASLYTILRAPLVAVLAFRGNRKGGGGGQRRRRRRESRSINMFSAKEERMVNGGEGCCHETDV